MIIIGHKAIKYPNFKYIVNIDDIASSIASDVLLFSVNSDKNYVISQHCNDNELEYAVLLDNINHALIYSQLGAKYLIYNSCDVAKSVQKIANEYFFDSKIICVIHDEKALETIAESGIDGVIFIDVLKNCKK